MTQPLIFISYSHKDEKEKDSLLSHLGVLQRQGLINLWSDDRIGAGADWKQEISEAMAQARVAILLISANFLSSDFNLGEEIPALLKRHQSKDLTIFPVIAKACAWRAEDWLTKLNVRPKDGRAIWGPDGHVDEDLAAIVKEVAEASGIPIPYDDDDEKPKSARFTNEDYNFYCNQVLKLSAHNSNIEAKVRIRALSLDRFKRFDRSHKADALKFLYNLKLINGPDAILDLSGVDLSGANLKNIDLRGVDLRGVDLSRANLQETDLRQADLSRANLREAILTNTNLRGAKLNATQLRGVDLSTANILETELVRADLIGVNLSGAKLGGVDLRYAFLMGANLKGASLDTNNLPDLSRDVVTSLSSALMGGADLSEANLIGVDLSGADLRNANLSSAIMRTRWVTSWGEEWWYKGTPDQAAIKQFGLKLNRTNLFAVDLSKAKLIRTDLREADLRKAQLCGANLKEAYLAGADLTGANLTDAKVASEQLQQARSLKHARMSDGELYTPTVTSLIGEVFNKTFGVSVLIGLGLIGLFRNCWGVIAGVIIGIACFWGLVMAYYYTDKILGVRWVAFWGTILNAIWGGTVFAILGGITGAIALIIMGGLWGLLQFIYSTQDGLRGIIEVIDWIPSIDNNIVSFVQLFALAGMIWGGIEGYFEGIHEYSWDSIDTISAVINIFLWGIIGMLLGGIVVVGLSSIMRSGFVGESIFIWMILGGIIGIIKGLHKRIKSYLMLKEEEGYWRLYL